MKVFVAIPSYDAKLTASCAQSLFLAAYHCAKHNIELHPHFIHGGIFIDHVRSLIVRRFLETDCTHLFFIDADLGFESSALARLVLSGLPVTAGIYPKRTKDKKRFNAKVYEPLEMKGDWLRMNRVATGFLCIEREVLEKMSEKAKTIQLGGDGEVQMVFHFNYDGDRFAGEDYSFCDDYNNNFDEPIWAYPDINMDHDGHTGNLHESLLNEIPDTPTDGGL
jgi:hypothetical protein